MATADIVTLPLLLFALTVVYIFGLAVFRLYFHRISHIPGPKLAALTYYYQTYYELFPYQGQFVFKCEELHKKYGPIIRIGPDEVHINDHRFYTELYGSALHRRNKSPLWYWMTGIGSFGDQSMFTTIDHTHHRLRRSGLGTYFSKRKVQELEPRIKEKVLQLRDRVLQAAGTKKPLDIKVAYGAMTLGGSCLHRLIE
jgi:hypothetical protein